MIYGVIVIAQVETLYADVKKTDVDAPSLVPTAGNRPVVLAHDSDGVGALRRTNLEPETDEAARRRNTLRLRSADERARLEMTQHQRRPRQLSGPMALVTVQQDGSLREAAPAEPRRQEQQ